MTSRTRTAGRGPRRPTRTPARTVLFGALLAAALIGGGVLTAAHLEDDDRFCASCHTQPESTFVQRAQAPAVDLASLHGGKQVACIQCHSGEGVRGRADAMQLGARDALAFAAGHYASPATLTVAIADQNCLKCHGDVASKGSFDNHFHRLLAKWQQLDPAAARCVSCHTGHDTGGSARLAFMEARHVSSVCQSCHRFAGEGD